MDLPIIQARIYTFIIAVFLVVFSVPPLFGQVEHNYPVGPENTNCDSLDISDKGFRESIETVENAVFRFDQKFKLSRTSGIRKGHFFSCDGMTGYLILTIGNKKALYSGVPKDLWNEFINASDIDGFYREKIRGGFNEKTGDPN